MQALEEKLAHLQRVVDDLSDVIARQDRQIDRLREQVDRLILREAEREEAGRVTQRDRLRARAEAVT